MQQRVQKDQLKPVPKWQVTVTLVGVLLAMFMSSIHQTIVGDVLPEIVGDLGGFSRYTWINVSYLVTLTVTVLLAGKLIDVYGRKPLYLIGLTIFALGSIAAGLSQTMTQLILLRGFQGIGAGIMIVNAYTVVGDLFPPEKRGKYQGW